MLRTCLRGGTLAALALVLVAPSVFGCSKQLTAEVQYAQEVDFSQYRTYRWITEEPLLIQPGAGNPTVRTVANERRIRAAVERELAAAGLEKVAGPGADLVLAFSLGTRLRYQVQGGSTSLEMVADDPATVTRGILTLYMFDPTIPEQIWSAATSKDLQPGDDPDAVINKAVGVLLAEFPPE